MPNQKQPFTDVFKEDVLRKFSVFTGKHLQACNFIKKRLKHKCFPVNIVKLIVKLIYSQHFHPIETNSLIGFYLLETLVLELLGEIIILAGGVFMIQGDFGTYHCTLTYLQNFKLDKCPAIVNLWLTACITIMVFVKYRSSPPEVFLQKGVLEICSKFTGEHSCRSVVLRTLRTPTEYCFCKYIQTSSPSCNLVPSQYTKTIQMISKANQQISLYTVETLSVNDLT